MTKQVLLWAGTLLMVVPVFSQGGPAGPMMGPGAMGHNRQERTPVTNAPYSATFTTSSVEKLQDGTVLNSSTTRTVARDSLGRVREQVTLPARSGEDGSPRSRSRIVITDPVAHTVTQLEPEKKIAVVHTLPQRAAGTTPDHGGPGASGNAPDGQDHPHGPRDAKNLVVTDLGSKTISGVVATGKRTTRTLPIGAVGNASPITSTHEEWYASDLKIEVSRVDVDPFRGTDTMVASGLTKAEPDPALFAVPSGYSIQQAPEHAHGAFHGPASDRRVPPPPPDVPPSGF